MIKGSFNGNIVAGRDVNRAGGNIVKNASSQPAPNWEAIISELRTLRESIDKAPAELQPALKELTKEAKEATDSKDAGKLKDALKKSSKSIGRYLRDASLAVLEGFAG